MCLAGDHGLGTAAWGRFLLSTIGWAAFVKSVGSGEVGPSHDHTRPRRVTLGMGCSSSRAPPNLRWLVLKEDNRDMKNND